MKWKNAVTRDTGTAIVKIFRYALCWLTATSWHLPARRCQHSFLDTKIISQLTYCGITSGGGKRGGRRGRLLQNPHFVKGLTFFSLEILESNTNWSADVCFCLEMSMQRFSLKRSTCRTFKTCHNVAFKCLMRQFVRVFVPADAVVMCSGWNNFHLLLLKEGFFFFLPQSKWPVHTHLRRYQICIAVWGCASN